MPGSRRYRPKSPGQHPRAIAYGLGVQIFRSGGSPAPRARPKADPRTGSGREGGCAVRCRGAAMGSSEPRSAPFSPPPRLRRYSPQRGEIQTAPSAIAVANARTFPRSPRVGPGPQAAPETGRRRTRPRSRRGRPWFRVVAGRWPDAVTHAASRWRYWPGARSERQVGPGKARPDNGDVATRRRSDLSNDRSGWRRTLTIRPLDVRSRRI